MRSVEGSGTPFTGKDGKVEVSANNGLGFNRSMLYSSAMLPSQWESQSRSQLQ